MASRPSALITGCGKGGIGHALAAEFQSNGYEVIATLLPHEDREHLTSIGVHVFDADVTSDQDTSSLRESVQKITDGKLSVLVNNAGIVYTMPGADTDVHEVEKMFAVNVFGPMRMVNFFHKMLVAARGTVVNIGSVGGIVPYIYGASYNASKAALVHYGNTLRAELKPFGVRVLNVISGEVSTNILKRDHGRQLPKDSLYKPLEKEFEAHLTRIPSTTQPSEYASNVFREIHKPTVGSWFWYGASTSIVYWGDALLPRTFWDWLFWRWFNFDKLKKAFEETKAKDE